MLKPAKNKNYKKVTSMLTDYLMNMTFPDSSAGKESACNAGDPGSISGLKDPLEKGQATHSSTLGLPLWLSW